MTDRTPPQDQGAEMAALGGMLLNRYAIAEVAEILTGGDFYKPAHEQIFTAILDLYADGQGADAVTVSALLAKRGELAKVGGAAYLHTIMACVPTAANAGYYAVIVREHALRRRLVEVGTRIAQMGYDTEDGADIAAIIDRAQAETHALDRPGTGDDEPSNIDAFDRMLGDIENGVETGIPTGFSDLDALTRGLHPEQLIILAARPAIGKSTAGLDIARHVAIRHRLTTAVFSLEMSRAQLLRRATSAEAGVELHHLAPGAMSPRDWERVANARERIVSAPLIIDASSHLTMMGIRTKARRMVQKRGLRLAIVDYLQLVNAGGRRPENRQQEVAEMSRGFKLLAKELQIPIIVLAQLNRGPEQRADKRPMMSDLRESGAIEQDADVVILLHREDAYERESPRAGEADFIVAKHRDGPTATITVAFQGHLSRFVDMAKQDWTPSSALAGRS
jgi:replicative DNA helicase